MMREVTYLKQIYILSFREARETVDQEYMKQMLDSQVSNKAILLVYLTTKTKLTLDIFQMIFDVALF